MISVVIPAYNAEKTLVESVHTAQHQTVTDLEILLVDDCSQDGTAAVAHTLAQGDPRIRVLRNPRNLGVAASRNNAIKQAAGDYIAFLDADDLWLPDKLEQQLDLMQRAALDLCYTGYSFIDENGVQMRSPYNVPDSVDLQTMLRENVIGCSTAVFRREAIGKIRMRPEYAHEDYVFWLELLNAGCRAGGINRPLMQYRVSPQGRSGNKPKAALGRWQIYRQFLQMGRLRSAWWFTQYSFRGIRKHWLSR